MTARLNPQDNWLQLKTEVVLSSRQKNSLFFGAIGHSAANRSPD
ncbi:hypothetical protein [Laspinema palackyanum]